MSIFTFAKTQFYVARLIGRKDYDGAIRRLEQSLSNSPADIAPLELIAWCHLWSQQDDMAIACARKILTYDPKHFEAVRLLSEIYAEKEEHETAVHFVRQGLENYPSPQPAPTKLLWLLRIAAKIIPRLGRIQKHAQRDLANPNAESAQWYSWAKEYLAWYESAFGGESTPLVH